MTSSDHSMQDGLTPSNEVGWGTLGLRRRSWANMLTSAPSLRWRFHLSLLCSPDDDVIAVFGVFVFDMTSHLTRFAHQMNVFLTCSATMSKWPTAMTRKWNWPELSSEPDFSSLNCLCIWARDADDTMTTNEDTRQFWVTSEHASFDLSQWGTWWWHHLTIFAVVSAKIGFIAPPKEVLEHNLYGQWC